MFAIVVVRIEEVVKFGLTVAVEPIGEQFPLIVVGLVRGEEDRTV
jgi:hypothetical protein